MKQAVPYARSTTNNSQCDNDRDLHQLQMCGEYAQEHGYETMAEVPQIGPSAGDRSSEPPNLTRLHTMAQAGEFDILVAPSPDRLSRNLDELLIIEKKLADCGIQVKYVPGECSPHVASTSINVIDQSQLALPKRPLARRATRLYGSQTREAIDDIS